MVGRRPHGHIVAPYLNLHKRLERQCMEDQCKPSTSRVVESVSRKIKKWLLVSHQNARCLWEDAWSKQSRLNNHKLCVYHVFTSHFLLLTLTSKYQLTIILSKLTVLLTNQSQGIYLVTWMPLSFEPSPVISKQVKDWQRRNGTRMYVLLDLWDHTVLATKHDFKNCRIGRVWD